MFNVLTIAREYGSGGAAIAAKVAERLGWILFDKEIIKAISRTAQVDTGVASRYDERVDSWLHRINRSGLWTAAIAGGAKPKDVQFFDAETMAALATDVIAKAGAEGRCVIVGRGSQCVLHSCARALHVFIYAPWQERLVRIKSRVPALINVGDDLRSTDRVRARYIRTYFGYNWKDPHLYHMMISSHLGEDVVAEMLIDRLEHDPCLVKNE